MAREMWRPEERSPAHYDHRNSFDNHFLVGQSERGGEEEEGREGEEGGGGLHAGAGGAPVEAWGPYAGAGVTVGGALGNGGHGGDAQTAQAAMAAMLQVATSQSLP